MNLLGVDIGSSYTKFALLSDSLEVKALRDYQNKGSEILLIDKKINDFLSACGAERETTRIAACGYGKENIERPDAAMTEITAIARGVCQYDPEIDCVIDIGAQDFKIIRIGPGGKLLNFCLNDKCSAGTGIFLEMLLQRLDIKYEQMDERYASGTDRIKLSSVCTVFATTEAVGLLARRAKADSVLRGGIDLIVDKIAPFVRQMEPIQRYALTGGLSSCSGVLDAFKRSLAFEQVCLPYSRYAGAIGAALALQPSTLSKLKLGVTGKPGSGSVIGNPVRI